MATINPVEGTSIPFDSATTFTITWDITVVAGNPYNDEISFCLADSSKTVINGTTVQKAVSGKTSNVTITPSDLGGSTDAAYLRIGEENVYGSDSNTSDWLEGSTGVYGIWYPLTHTTACGAPTSPKVSATVSRDAVTLSWSAGSAGTNNSVTGYDVQYRESTDGSSWGSWQTASGSPVTGTSLSVSPSSTVGSYRQYRVRTRGSAGESYYSGWVTSTNTLRRKWNAFGAWTDPTLTAGVSGIRAVHLMQLQERVSTIRAFYGLAAYSFTAVTARKTKIALWASLISEIRTAIDGITTSHDAWNTLEAGKPRIAHITQLRNIIDNL